VSLLFISACDCTNPNQELPTVSDNKHKESGKPKSDVVEMKAVPNKLTGDDRKIEVNFALLNNFTELLLKECTLKVTCSNPAGVNTNSYLIYLNDNLVNCRETTINEKLAHFQLISLIEQNKVLTLPMILIPDTETERLEIKFELLDKKGSLIQNDQVVWERGEGNSYKLKLEPHKEKKLVEEPGEQKELVIKVNNMGSDIAEVDQLKLIVTRVGGTDAILSISGQDNAIQELQLGSLMNNGSISKNFIIHSVTDKKAKFLFRLLYKGEEQDFLYVDWEKIMPSIKIEYLKKINQLKYTISNYKALQIGVLQLKYKNLSNNAVTVGGATEQSIFLSTSYDYAGMLVKFNNETSAEFEFKLLYKDKPVVTETITLKNLQVKIIGIGPQQGIHGERPTVFYVKNISGIPINISQLYIQCTNMDNTRFTLYDKGVHTIDAELKTEQSRNGHTVNTILKYKLSDFIGKDILGVEEQIPITIRLKDTNNQKNLDFDLQIYDESDGKAILLDERMVTWTKS
jgi:hypothetical protein